MNQVLGAAFKATKQEVNDRDFPLVDADKVVFCMGDNPEALGTTFAGLKAANDDERRAPTARQVFHPATFDV